MQHTEQILRRQSIALLHDISGWLVSEHIRRLQEALKAYDPNEARVPLGSSTGGQWTSDGSNGGATVPRESFLPPQPKPETIAEPGGITGIKPPPRGTVLSDAEGDDIPGIDGTDDGLSSLLFLPLSGLFMDDAGDIFQLPDYQDELAPDTWASDWSKFETHYEDHGFDFDASSPWDYADQANDFYNVAQTEKLPMIETYDGWIKTWDPQTNMFGVYNPQGQTETFLKPTSPTYFERQIPDVVANGGRVINPLPEEIISPEIFIP